MSEADRERWDARYAEGSHVADAAPAWLDAVAGELPARGRALDVAAGTGPAARWLAARGLDVLAVDVSPLGLERLEALARRDRVRVETRALDLETEPVPAGPWDAIACFHYLQRDLFPRFRERLAPGGALVCELATRRNLERHAHPSARFLVGAGELPALARPLEVVYYREGWLDGRSLARLVARRARDPV